MKKTGFIYQLPFVVISLFLISNCDTNSPPETSILAGTVIDEVTKSPIEGAMVSIGVGPDKPTGQNGEFTFNEKELRIYQITVTHGNYRPKIYVHDLEKDKDGGDNLLIELTPILPELSVSIDNIDFGTEQTIAVIEILNIGERDLEWSITEDMPWLEVNPVSGVTSANKTGGEATPFSDDDVKDNQGSGNFVVLLSELSNSEVSGKENDSHSTSNEFTDASYSSHSTPVIISVDRSAVTEQGIYNGTLVITANPGGTHPIGITIEVLGPRIELSKSNLDFGTSVDELSLTINNSSGIGSFSYSIDADASWITVTPESGTVSVQPDIVNIRIDRTSLEPGNYTQLLVITTENAGTATVDVIVTVFDPTAPQLGVSAVNLNFGDDVVSLPLTVTNAGGQGRLEWSASNSQPWLLLSNNSGSLGSGENEQIEVSVNRVDLAPGTYNDRIAISSNSGPKNVAVQLLVSESPVLSTSVDILDFGADETMKSFTVSNSGSGNLNWALSANQPWISFSNGEGSNRETINVTVNRAGLELGDYSGEIEINSNGGRIRLVVEMKVLPPNQPPVAQFVVNPDQGDLQTIFSFDASNSSDDRNTLDELLFRWRWEVGLDYTEWSGSHLMTHQYSDFGQKEITLEVQDESGEVSTASKMVELIENQPPQASFEVMPSIGDEDTIFEVDASASTDDRDLANTLEVRWQWASGQPFSEWTTVKVASHQYQLGGEKTITLEVRDQEGAIGTTSNEVQVLSTNVSESESNDIPNQAQLITSTGMVSGRIGGGSDAVDWFKFIPPANGRVDLDVINKSAPGTASANVGVVYLLDENQAQLASINAFKNCTGCTREKYPSTRPYSDLPPGGMGSTAVTVTGGEEYFVVIFDYASNHLSPYEFYLDFVEETTPNIGEPNQNLDEAFSFNPDTVVESWIGGPDQADWYSFVPDSDGAVRISVKNNNPSSIANSNIGVVYMLNRFEQQLTSINAFKNCSGCTRVKYPSTRPYFELGAGAEPRSSFVNVLAGETYYVVLFAYNSVQTAPYELKVEYQ